MPKGSQSLQLDVENSLSLEEPSAYGCPSGPQLGTNNVQIEAQVNGLACQAFSRGLQSFSRLEF